MIKQQDVLKKIMWFNNRFKFDIDFFEFLQPQRYVSNHPKFKSGLFYSEKGKRQIQYESNLELDFIKSLEINKRVQFYFEQPVQIQFWRGRKKQIYTPDFGVYLTTGEFVLVEIKNLPNMLENRVQTKIEGLMQFCSDKGFGLLLTDGKHTFDYMKKYKLNSKFEKAILKALEDGTLRKNEVELIKKEYNGNTNELLKIIIRNNLQYKSFPLKLSKDNKNQLFRKVFIQKKKFEDLPSDKYSTLFKTDNQ